MITRRIGKIVRGKATPFQVLSAALLGASLAFLPSFGQAAGLYVFLGAALVVLNANLGVAVLVGLPAKLLSLALLPVSFAVGRFLLDGPTSGLFRTLINAPVFAYFGFETYVTTGGLAVGAVIGLVAGLVLVRTLQRLRRTLSSLETGSDRYREFTSKRWVRFGTFVLVGGGHGKKTYEDLLQKKVGNPVRVFGAFVVVAFAAFAFAFQGLLASSFLSNALRGGLERVNGATVDIADVDLDLGAGRLRIDGLALADRDDLDTDVFRSGTLEADLSTTDLLRKRFAIDRLVVRDAVSGAERAVTGQRIGREPEPAPPEPEPEAGWEDAVSLDEVLADARLWRDRLATARRWLARLAPEEPSEEESEARESLRERLERRAAERGYGALVATHLIDEHPRFVLSELVIEGMRVVALEDDLLDVHAKHLSTAPHLLEERALVTIASRSERFELAVGSDRLRLALRGFEVDEIAGNLSIRGERPVAGGTLDLVLDGGWSRGRVGHLDLPLRVTLHDTTLTLPQHGSTTVDVFQLPIALRGPLDDPAIRLDDEELTAALIEAGKAELAARVRNEAGERFTEAREDLEERLEEELAEQGIDTEGLREDAEEKAAGLLRGFLDDR